MKKAYFSPCNFKIRLAFSIGMFNLFIENCRINFILAEKKHGTLISTMQKKTPLTFIEPKSIFRPQIASPPISVFLYIFYSLILSHSSSVSFFHLSFHFFSSIFLFWRRNKYSSVLPLSFLHFATKRCVSTQIITMFLFDDNNNNKKTAMIQANLCIPVGMRV